VSSQRNRETTVCKDMDDAACSRPARCSWATSLAHVILLVLVSVVTMVLFVSATEIWVPDESRFALAGRQMFETGDYLVPQLKGRPYTNKPPLFMWLQTGAAHLIGHFDVTAARLPAALSGVLLVILTYCFARLFTTARAAFWAGMVLATSALPVLLARTGVTDMTLALLVTAAIMLLFLTYRTNRPTLCMTLAFVVMALGVLVKGPVALVVPLLVGAVNALVSHRARKPSRAHVLPGFLLLVAIVAAWVVPACMRGGPYYTTKLVFTEGLQRAFARRNMRPFDAFFYVPVMLWGIFPWSFLFLGALLSALRPRNRSTRRRMLVPLVWFGVVFVLFSLMHSKRHPYILLLFPAAAMLVGDFIDGCALNPRPRLAHAFYLLAGALTLAAAAILGYGCFHMALGMFEMTVAVAIIALAGAAIVLASRRPVGAAAVAAIGFAVVYAWVFAAVMPALERFRPARTFCAVVNREVPADARLVSYKYGSHLYDFYVARTVSELEELCELVDYLAGPRPAYCLMRTKEFFDLPGRIRSNFEVVARESIPFRDYNMILVRAPARGADRRGAKPIIIAAGGAGVSGAAGD